MALKVRALCYQASDLFNGNPDYANFVNKNGEPLFSAAPADPKKWERAAEAAVNLIKHCEESGVASLVEGNSANSKVMGYVTIRCLTRRTVLTILYRVLVCPRA